MKKYVLITIITLFITYIFSYDNDLARECINSINFSRPMACMRYVCYCIEHIFEASEQDIIPIHMT